MTLFRSIRIKLVYILTLSAFVAIFISSAVLFWYSNTQSEHREIKSIQEVASIAGANLIASLEFDDSASATAILGAFHANSAVDAVYLVKPDGVLFAHFERKDVKAISYKQHLDSHALSIDSYGLYDNGVVVVKPIYLDLAHLGSLVIISNTDKLQHAIQSQFIIQLIVFVVVLLLMVFLAFRLQKIFTTPIFKLKSAMEAVSERGDYETRIDYKSSDEYQSLIDGFHAMIATIKEQKSQLESYTDSLSQTIKLKTQDIESQRHQLELMVNAMDKNVITSETDNHGIITYVSEAFCQISGYTKEELLGKPHNMVRHADMPKEAFKEMWATLKSGHVWKGEVKNRRKDGSFYWVDATITPKCTAEGEPCGYTAIRHDITAKKESQAQLEQIQRFQSLTSGREARMVELKRELNEYAIKNALPIPYPVVEEIEQLHANSTITLSIEEPKLEELLDVERLQLLMEYFYSFMHIPLAIIDLEGKILVQSKWQRACTDFHRANEESCKRCIESDIDLASKLTDGEKFSTYLCKNGLTDCASPIIIEGKHLANFFIGQFMITKPDMDYFSEQAKRFGYNLEEYIEAIKDVPIIDESKLSHILGFLVEITNMVTSLTVEKLHAKYNNQLLQLKAQEMEVGQIAALNLAEDANLAKTALAQHQEHLEELIVERTKDLDDERTFVNSIMNTQSNFVITTDGKSLKSANKSMLEFYGVDSVETFMDKYGMCVCDTFKTDAPEGFLQKMVEGKKWVDYVYDNPTKTHKAIIVREGQSHTFTVTADKFKFKNETLNVAVLSDVTQIEEQKASLQNILDNGPLGIAFTAHGRFGYTNPEFQKSFDLREGDEAIKIYANPEDRAILVKEVQEKGFVKNKEFQFVSRGNVLRDYLTTFLPINHGGDVGLMGFLLDITEQKNLERENKENQEKLSFALKAANMGTWKYDIQANELTADENGKRLYGLENVELDGTVGQWFTFIHPDDIATLGQVMQDTMANHRVDYVTTFRVIMAQTKEVRHIMSLGKFSYGENNEPLHAYGLVWDITDIQRAKQEVEILHKHTRDSIEYASLIQHSLIPSNDLFRKYFSDYLTIWHPKDIVGGDVYLFDELRTKDECLLFVIDCTGHGVPGAFVTMLVKAIEREVVAKINNDPSIEVSPAWILAYFNRTMKKLLKQEDEFSISNAGFDGAILYYNKTKKILRYAGAETPLFYIENGNLTIVKGDHYSIGYKKSDAAYRFKDHEIPTQEGMEFFLTTDGFIDQNGGEKGFPFGKKRFGELLLANHSEPLAELQESLLYTIQAYQGSQDRNDDMTIVGIKI